MPPFLAQLVMEVMKKLEGAFALLIKSSHYPGELVACKRGSPMILGVREPSEQRRASFIRQVPDPTLSVPHTRAGHPPL